MKKRTGKRPRVVVRRRNPRPSPLPENAGRQVIEYSWPRTEAEAVARLSSPGIIVNIGNKTIGLRDALAEFGITPEQLALKIWGSIKARDPHILNDKWMGIIKLAKSDEALMLARRLNDCLSPAFFNNGWLPMLGDMPLSHNIGGRNFEIATPGNLAALELSLNWIRRRRKMFLQTRKTADSIVKNIILETIFSLRARAAILGAFFQNYKTPEKVSDHIAVAVFDALVPPPPRGGMTPAAIASWRFRRKTPAS